VDVPAIGPHHATLGEDVVHRHGAHLRRDRQRLIRAGRVDRREVVPHRAVDAGLVLARHRAAMAVREPLGEGPRLVVAVPVPRLGRHHALRGGEAQRLHVVDVDEHADQPLALPRQAEFAGLLDGVDGIRPGIRERHHLRLRGLRLQQEGRKIRGVERMPRLPQHAPAIGGDDAGGAALERVAALVVDRQEIPGLAALGHHRARRAVRQRVAVGDPVEADRRALPAGQLGGGGRGVDDDPAALPPDLLDRQRDRAVRHVDDHVDAVGIDPASRHRAADIGLVLVVAADHLDRMAADRAMILGRHARRQHRAGAGEIGVGAGEVGQHADAHDIVGKLRAGGEWQCEQQCERKRRAPSIDHGSSGCSRARHRARLAGRA